MDHQELSAWLRLSLTPGVGNHAARRLLAAFGMPQAVFAQSEAALAQVVGPAQAQALCTPPPTWQALVQTTADWLEYRDATDNTAHNPAPRPARAVLTLGDPRYPAALLDTEDPPLLLYCMGAARWLEPGAFPGALQCLAVVGSRNPSAQGAENARAFAHALRTAGLTVVSGLALGVDAAAHEGALLGAGDIGLLPPQTPATVAVVGTGLDRVYPRKNLDLARRIAAHGLIISEYPLGTPPLPANFPKRNRIIAGLSQGTLVVEAALASGSLITARMAAEQGREVFAIPGSIHAPQSRGCHALIRQGAKLVESAQDILEEWPGPARCIATSPDASVAATETSDNPVLDALGYDPIGLDALQARTGTETAALQVALFELELAGLVARLPGGLFQRVGRA